MTQIIKTHLPEIGQPFSWATHASGVIYTAHGPIRADGSIDIGPIENQARLTFQNLKLTLEAAGASLKDVAQVLIYLIDVEEVRTVDSVYREFFEEPYPNRSTVIAKGLVVPGMKIEIVVYASAPAGLGS
ncbi:Enamine deaminase RidA, house cleaning of reactive enamine intermediates, YjgF/YER057c/UK114 family [Paraburkholderia fungorum]|uniref:Enamine deaminase RidA, house cleaning of reactive enamine intermediates, YjgF/YER057c/UK114 family n=1 Tax=Paraburkholderia fungorum TaxID=134537 RepID=A0A1H1K0N5_9BURK|nr:RidA family protein [Paraburkholderia fungorum]SDR55539.1 Enamine deaminase RidA, house cleaning of reactive enamine intermediates, YjgF/YER057c/UK114 family [Paraburkholderia fungorum]